MNELLALELEASQLPVIELDVLMLDWLCRLPGRTDEDPELWIRHANGLASSLSGAVELLRDILGDAAWMIASPMRGSKLYRAYVMAPGTSSFSIAEAPTEGCAMCAAIVRAQAAAYVQAGRDAFRARMAVEPVEPAEVAA